MTDKAIDQAAERPDRETFIFNRMMTQFIEHYQPRDLRERSLFAADIMSLMRQQAISIAQAHGNAMVQMYERSQSVLFLKPDQPKESPDGVATPAAAEPPAT